MRFSLKRFWLSLPKNVIAAGLDGADARRRRQRARFGQRVADAGEDEEPVLPEKSEGRL